MKKMFTLLIVTFPILSVYSVFTDNLSIADFFMLILFPFVLMDYSKKIHKSHFGILSIAFFAYYLLLTFFLQLGMNTGVGVLSSIRYILYLFYIIFSVKYFLFDFGIKVLGVLTLSVSVYVIIQFTYFMIFSSTLPWYLPGLRVIDQNFILIEQSEYYLTFYRPTGIFLEPTHYAQFCVVYLTYLLLYDLKRNTQILKSLLVTVGVVVSGSSLGLIFLCFIWGIWFLKTQLTKLSPLKIILSLVLLFIVFLTIFNVDYLRYTVERIMTDEGFNGAAVGYRFDSLSVFVNGDMSLLNWLIGFGRSTNEVYFTGIFYFIYSNGILGLLLYLWICVVLIIRTSGFSRWLTITALVLSVGSEFMTNFGILFYLAFVLNEKNTVSKLSKEAEKGSIKEMDMTYKLN